ncbi:MAG: hypothetical protein ACT6Q7_07635 [Blastomonas fulva]|uniref:hypothetical protein n=1 Tax=Blastomonas TaxID=150203 RepID=UPI0006CDB99A|nr:hypothetical protein [Blastomonas sp. AAP25]AOG00263.1 hypothetical protein BSY18_2179 [Blastomonas sp. RAC04]KPF76023.1 hypothetical protein IP68_05840 [Blastomonas sp. AAP25]
MNAGVVKKLTISGLLLGTAALVPSIALAFSSGFDSRPVSIDARGGIGSFTPASVDPRLAEKLKFSALRGDKMFRFTPAASANSGTRALTIAVRVRPDSAKAINIRPDLASDSGQGAGLVQITPTAFSLGVAKGFTKFALPSSIRQPDEALPDIALLGRGDSAARKSRFSPRIEVDDIQAPTTRAVRPFNDQGSYSLDVGGAYKVTRNLDVTAGIRLRSERDRLTGLTNEQYDSQAVYVGTEFRF